MGAMAAGSVVTDASRSGIRRRWRQALAVVAVPALLAGLAGCFGAPSPAASGSSSPTGGPTPAASPVSDPEIAAIVEDAMADLHLAAVIVQAQVGDETVISQAFGESMSGVPATTDMSFRNGAVAFEYIGNLLLQYVDDGTVALDDTIDQWAPELPESDKVTLLMLTNQTTGYPDYETDPGWTAAYNADPFHEFTYQERIDYAFSRPMQFEPGTNWSYAHTNFMILGEILSKIGGAPLDQLLQEKVLGPMGLTETRAFDSAIMPEPVLHAYSSERRAALGVPADSAFYEESTYWNPVWGTPIGGAQTTTIGDMVKTAIAVGTGELLSEGSFHAMTDSNLIGFGEKLPVCEPSCFTQIEAYNYGLGVVRSGEWMLQNPQLSGYSAAEAYLPGERIAIAVAVTYAPGAFRQDGTYDNSADRIWRLIGAHLAPEHAPPQLPPAA
jgi:CubicO group peptidase (beta-lactamase class C family)